MSDQPFFIPAVIFALLAVPLILGVVPPNPVYGIRTRRTMASPDVWRRVNRAAGWAVLAVSAIYLEVARAWPYSRTAPNDFQVLLVHLAAFALPLVLALVAVSRYAKK